MASETFTDTVLDSVMRVTTFTYILCIEPIYNQDIGNLRIHYLPESDTRASVQEWFPTFVLVIEV